MFLQMFLGNDETVYMLDKAEGNKAQINNHPAWGAAWYVSSAALAVNISDVCHRDIASHDVTLLDVKTNVFCASGMHLPNGSFVTFGGNGAVGIGGGIGSELNPGGFSANFDNTYQDFDGTKAIRLINPCKKSSDDFTSSKCTWFDDPSVLSMQAGRWYSTAEPLGDGSMVLIGGYKNGGYINRNYPNSEFDRGGRPLLHYLVGGI